MLLLRLDFFKTFVSLLFILWVYLLSAVEGKQVVRRGIMDNINHGIRYAGQMLGLNTAADVANLVSNAFGSQVPLQKIDPKNRDEENSNIFATKLNPAEMLKGLLKMIGFDAGKLGALAINAILMIAQLIGNTLATRQQFKAHPKSSEDGRTYDSSQQTDYSNESSAYDEQPDQRSGREHIDDNTPIDWILSNPPIGFSKLFQEVTDRQLPEKLTNLIEGLEDQEEEGGCIKLLMCKSSPFIWKMQKSVSNRMSPETELEVENGKPTSTMLASLPSLEEYRHNSKLCEQRFSNFCKSIHN